MRVSIEQCRLVQTCKSFLRDMYSCAVHRPRLIIRVMRCGRPCRLLPDCARTEGGPPHACVYPDQSLYPVANQQHCRQPPQLHSPLKPHTNISIVPRYVVPVYVSSTCHSPERPEVFISSITSHKYRSTLTNEYLEKTFTHNLHFNLRNNCSYLLIDYLQNIQQNQITRLNKKIVAVVVR